MKKTLSLIIFTLVFILTSFTLAKAQTGSTSRRELAGLTLPSTCISTASTVDIFNLASGVAAVDGRYYCSSLNTWTKLGPLTSANIITALGYTPENVANKDTDGTLAANSDTKYPSQKATKTYVDAHATSPGGSNTQVQYNNSSAFGGISGATTNGTKLILVGPDLGTPASGTLTNTTGLPISTGLTGAGTGVLTALGVNGGSAGAFVVNGGALGTPSSGTLSSATGLPVSTGISGLGTGVATALAVANNTAGGYSPIDGTAELTNKTLNANVGKGTWTASGTWTLPAHTVNGILTLGTQVTIGVGATSSALTDLLINPTTKLSGNLIDVQVNNSSKFSVNSAGLLTAGSSIVSGGAITTANGSSLSMGQARSLFYSGTDGVVTFANSGLTNAALTFRFGGDTNSFAAIGRDVVNGFTLQSAAGTATWNDASTANSGTVANRYLFGIAAPTLTSTGTSVTNTVASTFYIGGAPTDSTNTTSTTKYALNVAAGNVKFGGNLIFTNLADSGTAPTISSGFGTSPTVPSNNGTIAFTINVGTGGTAQNGVIGLPAATTGWICHINDRTTNASFVTAQTATTTTTATVQNYSRTTGLAVAWTASDILECSCRAY